MNLLNKIEDNPYITSYTKPVKSLFLRPAMALPLLMQTYIFPVVYRKLFKVRPPVKDSGIGIRLLFW